MAGAVDLGVLCCGLIFVYSKMAGIAADEGFIEHAPGELIEFFFFDRLEKARADFGGLGHVIQRDFALFAFAFKTLAEGSHLAFSLASLDGPSMYTELSPMLRKEKGLGKPRRSRIVGHFGNISNVTSYNFAATVNQSRASWTRRDGNFYKLLALWRRHCRCLGRLPGTGCRLGFLRLGVQPGSGGRFWTSRRQMGFRRLSCAG